MEKVLGDRKKSSEAAWSFPAPPRADALKLSCPGLFQAGMLGLVKMASDKEGNSY